MVEPGEGTGELFGFDDCYLIRNAVALDDANCIAKKFVSVLDADVF